MTDWQPPGAGARRVAAYYDRLAPVYGDGQYFAARRAALLGAVGEEIAAARAVLDLGCGNGAFLAELASAGAASRVVGLDLSAAMLAAAQRRVPGVTGLVRADAEALPFRAGAFDLVFVSHVLQLLPDVDACLGEVACVLRPGGVLIATIGAVGWRDLIHRVIGPDAVEALGALFDAMRLPVRRDDQSELTTACERAGLLPTWRHAGFSVSWPALIEWVRVRWLNLVDEAVRLRAERWLASMQPFVADRTMDVAETLLVAGRR